MNISTKGRYGVEALMDLAIHAQEGYVSMKNIAERCGVSDAYTTQLFNTLKKAGIVTSVRGAQGGYMLARQPEEIRMSDVLTALEGPMVPVECIAQGAGVACDRYENCTTRTLWDSMAKSVDALLSGVTLADLLTRYRDMEPETREIEFYI